MEMFGKLNHSYRKTKQKHYHLMCEIHKSIFLEPFACIKSISIGTKQNIMNKIRAQKVLMLLDRINKEIDILGHALLKNTLKPVPLKAKDNLQDRFGR